VSSIESDPVAMMMRGKRKEEKVGAEGVKEEGWKKM
jgi:hypothetical protein